MPVHPKLGLRPVLTLQDEISLTQPATARPDALDFNNLPVLLLEFQPSLN